MNIAFFGTPPFTVDFLQTLAAGGFTPSLVVTNPDRPAGRGMIMTAPEPKVWAEKHSITVLQPDKLDDAFFAELTKTEWDLFVVVAYGQIMPERVINLPKYGTINVHYSLLPKYRGATPVESAILNGDQTTGIAIQQMRYKLDTGPIFVKSEMDIAPDDTARTLRDKLNAEALRLLVPTITGIFSGSIIPIEQDDTQATHCGKIKKEDGLISLSDDPIELDRKYSAYDGWPGLYFYTKENVRVKITKAHFDGTFVIDEVIPENGKRMRFEDWSA
jgi:methionyl-tRNA formyltransferase